MYKSIVISGAFAKLNAPGGQIERAMYLHVDKKLIEFKIISSDTGTLQFKDVDIEFVHENKNVRYIAAAIRRILPDVTFLPDYNWWSWGRNVVKYLQSKDLSKIDYIQSISYPCASHWAALQLKKTIKKPWIAQFLDPWVENPYRRFRTRYFKSIDYEMEREVAVNADLIIHNSQAMIESWLDRYGSIVQNKMIVLPMPISLPTNYVQRIKKERLENKITISHIGSLAYGRTSEVFIKSVKAFIAKYPDSKERLQIRYVGDVSKKDRDIIKELCLEQYFEIVGPLSEEDCRWYYQNSDAFMAVDSQGKLFYPSKILKYFYFGAPILGIGYSGSVLEHEMQRSHNTFCSINNPEGIMHFLYNLVFNYSKIANNDKRYWEQYLPMRISKQYEDTIIAMMKSEPVEHINMR